MNQLVVAALYQFVELPDYRTIRSPLLDTCMSHGLRGTLLLAEEGINGTIAGTREGIDAVKQWLDADGRFDRLEYKESLMDAEGVPFYRMKVKIKKEIVTLGQGHIEVSRNTGKKVDADTWDALIQDPDCIVIDTRNTYETAIGTFERSTDPNTTNFREFPEYVNNHLSKRKKQKVAMFCTGGIRCEKASAYMREQGFEDVYQLDGGILQYLEDRQQQPSQWRGQCFVFDERVAVGADLKQGDYLQCFGCRRPILAEDTQRDEYVAGVSCHHCADKQTDQQRERFSQRQKQIHLAKTRGVRHMANKPEHKVAS